MAQMKKPTATGETSDGRFSVISVKGTVEFRDWLADVAERERVTIVQYLEKAAVDYAVRKKYPRAPRRTAR